MAPKYPDIVDSVCQFSLLNKQQAFSTLITAYSLLYLRSKFWGVSDLCHYNGEVVWGANYFKSFSLWTRKCTHLQTYSEINPKFKCRQSDVLHELWINHKCLDISYSHLQFDKEATIQIFWKTFFPNVYFATPWKLRSIYTCMQIFSSSLSFVLINYISVLCPSLPIKASFVFFPLLVLGLIQASTMTHAGGNKVRTLVQTSSALCQLCHYWHLI